MDKAVAPISQAKFDAFVEWNSKQNKMKVDGIRILEMMLVWNDKVPGDVWPLDLSKMANKLKKFLEVYAHQVRIETLEWVGDNLSDGLVEALDDDPYGVDMASVIKIFEEEAMEEDED